MHEILEEDLPQLDFPPGQGTPVYRGFVTALLALLNNNPTNSDLLGVLDLRQDKEGEDARIPVNLVNVIKESGNDRKGLIGKNPRYRKLAAHIRNLKTSVGVTTTTRKLVDTLQNDKRELNQTVRVLRSKLAEKSLQLADSRRDLALAEKEAKRWRQKAGQAA